MKIKMSIEGIDDLNRALGQLPKATARNVLHRVLKKAAEPIRATAERLAPDDPRTGAPDLHTSIITSTKLRNKVGKAEFAAVMRAGGSKGEAVAAMRSARRASGESFAEIHVGPGAGGEHGVFQEFGTVNHPAQPFMRPAWDANKDRALEIIKAELGSEIQKAAQRVAKRLAKKAGKL